MAFAVPSVGVSGAYGATAVITKPTGLATGELMVALIEGNAGVSCSIDTLSGWTLVATQSRTNGSVSIQYKIADAGDVAASNFTFTGTSVSRMSGAILRVTGNTATGSFDTSDADTNNAAASATISFTTTVSPAYDGSLIVMVFGGSDGNAGAGSIGTYIASDGSLSWSEAFDVSTDTGSVDPIGGGAYAIQTTKTALTSYGATLSHTKDDHNGIVAVFTPQINATATHSLLSADADFFAPTASAGVSGNASLLSADADFFAPEVDATSPSQWTAETKPTTSWTPESK